MKSNNYLVIPDLHLPYEHPKALEFCCQLKKEFKVDDKNVYSLGDEAEMAMMSQHPKSADSRHTANQELQELKDKISVWGDHFPYLKLCYSNHATRYWRKTTHADIPSSVLIRYRDFIGAPQTWRWEHHFVVNSDSPFLLTHGDGYSGPNGHRQMALNNGISTMHGHFHSNAGISWIVTMGQTIWACNAGCLINPEDGTFGYAANNRFKSSIGAAVIMDGGKYPLWIPLQ